MLFWRFPQVFQLAQQRAPRRSGRNQPRELDMGFDSCESLEARCMLAGDVTASLRADGTLIINGDSQSNHLTSGRLGNGDLVIVGLDGTTVNGQITFSIGSPSVNDLRVNLRGGNNFLRLSEMEVDDDFRFRSAGGEDTLSILDSAIGGDTLIRTGAADDMLVVARSTFSGRVNTSTQGGDDVIIHLKDNDVQDAAILNTSSGDDFVFIAGNFDASLKVRTGSGSDDLAAFQINSGYQVVFDMGSGNDVVAIGTTPVIQVDVLGRGGDDLYLQQPGVLVLPDLNSIEDSNFAFNVNAVILTGINTFNVIYENRGGLPGDIP